MLILTRKQHERIIIGDQVWIIFLGMTPGDEIKLGFTAPSSTVIHREEIYHKIKSQQQYPSYLLKKNIFHYEQDNKYL